MLRQLLVVTLLFLMTNSVFAHQQKAAETTLLFNKRSGQLEVMHRFYLHDTEHAVQSLFDKGADILDSEVTQRQFANYVAEQFQLRSLAGEPLKLVNVGFEVDGKFFWVYQEAPQPESLTGLQLFNGALRELWPTQVNMVNIEGQGEVKTLYFSEGKDWLRASF